MPGVDDGTRIAYTAAAVGFAVFLLGLILSFWLPQPKAETSRSEHPVKNRLHHRGRRRHVLRKLHARQHAGRRHLLAQGHDALLIPTYTPIRTDEADVSQHRVFFGGINVFLQQKSALFRHTPWFLDRLLDFPRLLRWVSRFAVRTQAEQLGELSLSMLRGDHGFQRKEIAKLCRFLENDVQPEIITVTNVLLSGMVPAHSASDCKCRLWACCKGTTFFSKRCPEKYRRPAIDLIRANCQDFAGFIATSHYYADFMASYLGLPRERIHVIHPGLNLKGFAGTRSEGPRRSRSPSATSRAFARRRDCITSSRPFAFSSKRANGKPCRLKISGWLGENNRAYLQDLLAKLHALGFGRRRGARRNARSCQQAALLSEPRRALGAHELSRTEGAVHSRSACQRRAGRAAAAWFVSRVDRSDRRRAAR